jgi:hypothetical protein
MKNVLIKNGVVTNIIMGDLPGSISCSDDVNIGWLYDGTTFTAPVVTPIVLTYDEARALAYPSIQDQLDDIYHNGVAGWEVTIKAVKDKYPKGE